LKLVEVVERFVLGKRADPALCEDAIVVTAGHAAVIDGATDISGRRYDGVSGGRWAMRACVEAIRAFPRDIDAFAAVEALTAAFAARTEPANERPSASVTIFSAARHEVWQVGDVGFRATAARAGAGMSAEGLSNGGAGMSGRQPRKQVDEIAAAFRAAIIAAEVEAGTLGADDPGRAAARALIGRQGFLRNTLGPYGFGAIDGRPVPRELVVVCEIPYGELVIASDGYPVIEPTLAESEAALARLLERDPWCVDELRGTKGLVDGQVSFDDRAYLRLLV